MFRLSTKSINILTRCLNKRREDLLWVVKEDNITQIDEELGNELREVISDELIENGFDGVQPNEYGIELEKLIDDIGRLFIN